MEQLLLLVASTAVWCLPVEGYTQRILICQVGANSLCGLSHAIHYTASTASTDESSLCQCDCVGAVVGGAVVTLVVVAVIVVTVVMVAYLRYKRGGKT